MNLSEARKYIVENELVASETDEILAQVEPSCEHWSSGTGCSLITHCECTEADPFYGELVNTPF
jgi:hypothetical protein